MSQFTIAIYDNATERTEFFKNLFMRDEYEVRIFDSLPALISFVETSPVSAILVAYDLLTTEGRKEVVEFFKRFVSSNLFVYNLPDNASKRLAFYELGARRVFDVDQPLDEIYYALAWPLKNIRGDMDKDKLYSSGNLDEVSLKILVNTLAREERSGVLRVITDNGSGKIYLNKGFITHAQVGLHTGEKALLHMLFWHQGRFSFNASTVAFNRNTVTISTIASLILAEKIRRQYVEDLKVTGPPDNMAKVRYAGDLMQSDIELDPGFLKLIEHPRRIAELLENQFYTNFETAAKLAELNKRGFLETHHPKSAQKLSGTGGLANKITRDVPVSSFFTRDETDILIEKLNLFPGSNGGMFILSTTGVASCNMLKALTRRTPDAADNSAIYHSVVQLQKDVSLQVFSLALNEFVLDDLSQNIDQINGIVFLVDVGLKEQFEYEKYIIRQIVANYDVPWSMGFIHGNKKTNWSKIQDFFDLSEEIVPQGCNAENDHDIKGLLLQMDKHKLKIYEVKTAGQNEEQGA